MTTNDNRRVTVVPAQPGWMHEVYALSWDEGWDEPEMRAPIIAWEITPPDDGGRSSYVEPISLDRIENAIGRGSGAQVFSFLICPPGSPMYAIDAVERGAQFSSREGLMNFLRWHRDHLHAPKFSPPRPAP